MLKEKPRSSLFFFPKLRYSNMKALQTSTLSHRNDYNKAHLLCSSPRLLLLHKIHVAELGFPGLFYASHLFYILTFRFSFAEGLRIFAHLAQQTLKSYKFHNSRTDFNAWNDGTNPKYLAAVRARLQCQNMCLVGVCPSCLHSSSTTYFDF